jgi:hypothetical protein
MIDRILKEIEAAIQDADDHIDSAISDHTIWQYSDLKMGLIIARNIILNERDSHGDNESAQTV